MSSILKALQKLESESRERAAGPVLLKTVTADKNYPAQQAWFRSKRFLGFICVGLILAAAAALVYLQKQNQPAISVSRQPPVQAVVKPPIKTKPETSAQPAEVPGETGVSPKSGKLPESSVPAAVTKGVVPEPVAAKVAPGDSQKREKPHSKRSLDPSTKTARGISVPENKKTGRLFETPGNSAKASRAGMLEGTKADSFAKRKDRGRSSAVAAAAADESRITDESPQGLPAKTYRGPDIKLQAISWTPDVKTRISVINGSIVREGGRVGSFLVYKINKDDVVLKKNGEMWKLVFRRQ